MEEIKKQIKEQSYTKSVPLCEDGCCGNIDVEYIEVDCIYEILDEHQFKLDTIEKHCEDKIKSLESLDLKDYGNDLAVFYKDRADTKIFCYKEIQNLINRKKEL